MAARIRKADGFRRYAFSIQYHGASFLGFVDQGNREDCILPDGTDIRGYRSVEGRVREALGSLVGEGNFENMQVSSRTDRGVHALKNTFHVDLRLKNGINDYNAAQNPQLDRLCHGLNFYMAKQKTSWDRQKRGDEPNLDQNQKHGQRSRKDLSTYALLGQDWLRYSTSQECRILSCVKPPQWMSNSELYVDQPQELPWNARFSATERTYVYRILNNWCDTDNTANNIGGSGSGQMDWGNPFEWDRSWILQAGNRHSKPLSLVDMQAAARYLEGTHDFSTFRAKGCQRKDPVVSMRQISVHSQPYLDPLTMMMGGDISFTNNQNRSPHLITIKIVGNSFLYRQVRNMVSCLVEVGLGKLRPIDVLGLLEARDRQAAPATAPPRGLFLADVQHGDLVI